MSFVFWLVGLYIIGNSLVFCMLVLSGDSFFSYIRVTTRIFLVLSPTLYFLRSAAFLQLLKVPLFPFITFVYLVCIYVLFFPKLLLRFFV